MTRPVYVCRWRCGWAGSAPVMHPAGPGCPWCGYPASEVDQSELTFGEACANLRGEVDIILGPRLARWNARLVRLLAWRP